MHLEELYVLILGTLSSVKENIWKDFQSVCRNCEKKKMPQKEDLAAHLGITVRAYRYYEEGKRYPDFQGLIALADYFGVTLDDLLAARPQGYKRRTGCPDRIPSSGPEEEVIR